MPWNILKIIIGAFVLYTNLLYWWDNRYLNDSPGSLEINAYQNTIYFGGFLISVLIDIYRKNITAYSYYISAASYGIIGFLMPTLEGKLMASALTVLMIVFWTRMIWGQIKNPDTNRGLESTLKSR